MSKMEHKGDCNHSNCTGASANYSVCQTISEMDWERGLWNAAFNGDKEKVINIIGKAKNVKEAVNSPDNAGYTALHYAARNGYIDICRVLLQNGANIDAQTRSGKATPLHKAAAAGNKASLVLLIQSGAAVDLQDADGQTALHKVVDNKHFDLVNILLEACPSLNNFKDIKGCNAIESPEKEGF